MATNFPTSLDSFTNPLGSDPTNSATVPHAAQHANANDAIEALEAKVGVNSSAVATSLDYKVTQAETNITTLQTNVTTLQTNSISKLLYDAKGDILVASAADTPAKLTAGANGLVLTTDSAETTGLKWAAATPLTTKGDLLTHSGSALAREAVGSNGQILMADSGATNGIRYVDLTTNRNLIINGHMQLAQRLFNAFAFFTTSGYYTVDRWRTNLSSLGSWAQLHSTDVPTGQGFGYSLRSICNTADASPSAGDFLYFQQRIEGQNLQRVGKGTASAKPLTLSFWVKTSTSGTMIVELEDVTNSRYCSASVSTTAGTWVYRTATFPADATGTWPNSNASALQVNFWGGAGSNYTSGTLGTTWHTTTANRAVGQTNWAALASEEIFITGVQLEVGSVATPFEFESISETVAKCQRYYEKSYDIDTNPGTANRGGSYWARLEERMADGAGTARFFAHVNFKQNKRTSSYTPAIYSQAGTISRVTLNRAGNSGTAGYYNLYVAASANSAYNTGTADTGEGAFTLQAQTTWLPTLSFATFHWVADAEL